MNVLVVGGGGREHALVWKLAQSPRVRRIIAAPGNPGIAQLAHCRPIAADNINGLLALAKEEHANLTIVGPEQPLALGLVDAFQHHDRRCVGPTARAAQLEASKSFAKIFMQKYGIPTAHYGVFTEARAAKSFVRSEGAPIVIKADGLAQGKGVVVARTVEEAETAIDAMLRFRAFGAAGGRVVIEEYLAGEEVSCIALVDGEHAILLESAQDHKRLCDGDQGPNTGGMGAYSPAPIMNEAMAEKVRARIIAPAVEGLRREGRPFVGFLYAGLMIVDHEPYVLEFNVRLGDPEAQALLIRLRSDLVELLLAAADKGLHGVTPVWDERPSACVVMASEGYPGGPVVGRPIHGLERVVGLEDLCVFHSGTALHDEEIRTSGGRVLGVTALGVTLQEAVDHAYGAVRRIRWEGMQYRRDIGHNALRRSGEEGR
ncbi:MAG: phosphoribosylamine--glycine ligase [Deltaproteobacteria bacterium]|nr:phosphoribosylamine--glycine ligase [Deltaproteobacteria bacterium]